jgi:ABC-type transporter Mla subunit MlaD
MVAENLGQSIQEMERIQTLIQSLGALSQSVHAATDQHRQVGWKTSELMGSFSSQVEGIHSLVARQRETSTELDDALGQVAESAESTEESRATLHSIVNELVKQSDELQEEVGGLWGAREED